MWETPIRVRRSQIVDAAPERAWSLLGSTAAWSLGMGADFAFDVPASLPDTGRLFVSLGAAANGLGPALFEVRDEEPGKMICVQDRDPQPIGTGTYTLSVIPSRRGVKVEAEIRTVYPREQKIEGELYWRRALDDWLDALRAVIEGTAPWPPDDMSAETRRPFTELAVVTDPVVAFAATHIAAPVDLVWRVLHEREAGRDDKAFGVNGRVPGTPGGAVGEMLYIIRTQPDGQLRLGVSVLRELEHERYLRWQDVGASHDEVSFVLAPDTDGTRLQLTSYMAAPKGQAEIERMKGSRTAILETTLRWYKDASEAWA
jgi:hypothetical protein